MGDVPAGEGWLAPGEVARLGRMPFPRRRAGYLLRRYAGKLAVAALARTGNAPADLARIEVGNDPGGAPFAALDGEPVTWCISLSDRAGTAACVAGPGPVGCDLELVEPRSLGFVADFFTPAERRHVADRQGDERDEAANLIWSAKESALKLLGTGLRRDTRTVQVLATTRPGSGAGEDGWCRLLVCTEEGGRLPGWWRRQARHVFTVVAAREGPPPSPVGFPVPGGPPGHRPARHPY